MADFKVFNDKFAFLFRKRLGPDDGGQFWLEFVEKADWEVLEKVLEKIAEVKERARRANGQTYISAPGSSEVKADYFDMLRDRKIEEQKARGVDGACGYCMGTGWLYCCFDEHNNAIDITQPFMAPYYAGLHIAACVCDQGYRLDPNAHYNRRLNNAKCGIPETLQQSHELYPMSGQQAFYHYFHKNWINMPEYLKPSTNNTNEH